MQGSEGELMKHCPACGYQWESKVPKPRTCPQCKNRLDGPPTKLVIPIATLREEKKRYITALNKFQPSAERSHAHGVLVGKIEVLEWLESETEKKRPTP